MEPKTKDIQLPTSKPADQGWTQFSAYLRSALANIVWPTRFTQTVTLTGKARLKIPVFDSDPTNCTPGEVALIGGSLKVCTSADTWTTYSGL